MKKDKKIINIQYLLSLFVIISTFSCNRGYGCPTNFKLSTLVSDVIYSLAQIMS
ncbi:MAG: hypothetical protein LW711_08985 [Saprospiraceae bacterium]|nr:hypothetical protein [Saprospiraceae bacterium]MCF8301207.1 hypothetical protein [Haliscomenobacter sp.]MCF8317546.1 hypothetical protein [Haliscomenobacter sp.]